jgi:hypothetical protein
MRVTPRITEAVHRLKSVFLEEPAREMTLAEACAVTGLEHATCVPILGALEDVHLVRRREDGVFVRRIRKPFLV